MFGGRSTRGGIDQGSHLLRTDIGRQALEARGVVRDRTVGVGEVLRGCLPNKAFWLLAARWGLPALTLHQQQGKPFIIFDEGHVIIRVG